MICQSLLSFVYLLQSIRWIRTKLWLPYIEAMTPEPSDDLGFYNFSWEATSVQGVGMDKQGPSQIETWKVRSNCRWWLAFLPNMRLFRAEFLTSIHNSSNSSVHRPLSNPVISIHIISILSFPRQAPVHLHATNNEITEGRREVMVKSLRYCGIDGHNHNWHDTGALIRHSSTCILLSFFTVFKHFKHSCLNF